MNCADQDDSEKVEHLGSTVSETHIPYYPLKLLKEFSGDWGSSPL